MSRNAQRQDANGSKPALEWISAAIGLVITLSLFGFIGWQGLQAPGAAPQITVEQTGISKTAGSYLVEFVARNEGSQTAADVEIEGTLKMTNGDDLESRLVLDYLPGGSKRKGGLLYPVDPRTGSLQIRAVGFSKP